jgi:hypothetical protein
MMKAACYHEIAQRKVHEQELTMIDVMTVSADRVAWVHPSAPLTDLKEDGGVRAYRAFLHELRQLGHVEGRT